MCSIQVAPQPSTICLRFISPGFALSGVAWRPVIAVTELSMMTSINLCF